MKKNCNLNGIVRKKGLNKEQKLLKKTLSFFLEEKHPANAVNPDGGSSEADCKEDFE